MNVNESTDTCRWSVKLKIGVRNRSAMQMTGRYTHIIGGMSGTVVGPFCYYFDERMRRAPAENMTAINNFLYVAYQHRVVADTQSCASNGLEVRYASGTSSRKKSFLRRLHNFAESQKMIGATDSLSFDCLRCRRIQEKHRW